MERSYNYTICKHEGKSFKYVSKEVHYSPSRAMKEVHLHERTGDQYAIFRNENEGKNSSIFYTTKMPLLHRSKSKIRFIGKELKVGDVFIYDTDVPMYKLSTKYRVGTVYIPSLDKDKSAIKIQPNIDVLDKLVYGNDAKEIPEGRKYLDSFTVVNIDSSGITLSGMKLFGGTMLYSYGSYGGNTFGSYSDIVMKPFKFKIYKKENKLLFI